MGFSLVCNGGASTRIWFNTRTTSGYSTRHRDKITEALIDMEWRRARANRRAIVPPKELRGSANHFTTLWANDVIVFWGISASRAAG